MCPVRVLLVDDHTVVRSGLRKVLESTPEITVIGEAGDGSAAVEAATVTRPDVVIMDIGLPDLNGIEVTRLVLSVAPQSRVLILSMHADEQYIQQSRIAGARGYLLKDVDVGDLVAAVLAVYRGETFFRANSGAAHVAPGPHAALSARELEVLALIGACRSNREIAETLEISVNTVETHRKHIIEKLDLHTTADLVRYAIQHGIAN